MRIIIVRHGQTEWNFQKKLMGRRDIPLNKKGLEQANDTREKLSSEKIDLIICSPLKRAKETAEIINKNRNIPIIYDERIIERNFGEFEGKEAKCIDMHSYWDFYKNNKYENSENIKDFFKRVYDFLDDIQSKYKGKNILIVAHGGISVPIACYFNKNIPKGSLSDLILENCQVLSYDI